MDWLTFVLVTLFVMAGYLYTVAPDLTLEDSGELAVGSINGITNGRTWRNAGD